MIRDDTLGAVVIIGLFGMFSYEGIDLLRDAHRTLRARALLVIGAQTPSHAIFTELSHPGPGAR